MVSCPFENGSLFGKLRPCLVKEALIIDFVGVNVGVFDATGQCRQRDGRV